MGNQKNTKTIQSGLGEAFVKHTKNSYSWQYIEKPSLDKDLLSILNKDLTILDAGCGNGRSIRYLLDNDVQMKNIIGVDTDLELLDIARKEYPDIIFLKEDLRTFKSDKHFDLITSIFVLHYFDLETTQRISQNFYSYTQAGGYLYFIVPHPIRWTADTLHTYFDRRMMTIPTSWNTKIPYFHKTIADYINLTTQAGFEIISIDEPAIIPEGKSSKRSIKNTGVFPHGSVY